MYEQYQHWHLTTLDGEPASKATFRRVWIENYANPAQDPALSLH
jgi:hypothetical protein